MEADYRFGLKDGFRIGKEYAEIVQFFLDHPTNRLEFDDFLAVRWEKEEGSDLKRPKASREGLQLLQREADRHYQRAQKIQEKYPDIFADIEFKVCRNSVSRNYLALRAGIDKLMSVAV